MSSDEPDNPCVDDEQDGVSEVHYFAFFVNNPVELNIATLASMNAEVAAAVAFT